MTLTTPTQAECEALAQLWHDGWHEAHAAHVPKELVARRSLRSFHQRLARALPRCRMACDTHGPVGFCQISTGAVGELEQLFVAARARSTGIALTLLRDGEARMAEAGCASSILYCLPENDRARRFYSRAGWAEQAVETIDLQTETGTFALPCLVFSKDLAQP